MSGISSQRDSAETITPAVYALQAFSFFFGITYLIAVIINYVKLPDVRGTWLESHFRWQIRTFWFSLLWGLIGSLTYFLIIGWIILAFDAIWMIYRITKGWIYFSDRKSMYS